VIALTSVERPVYSQNIAYNNNHEKVILQEIEEEFDNMEDLE